MLLSKPTRRWAPASAVATKRRWTPPASALALLETIYRADSVPTLAVRNQIAHELSIDPRQVQIWFQNRRQRSKREATDHARRGGSKPLHAATTTADAAEVGQLAAPHVCVENLLDTATGARALRTAARTILLNNPLLRHPGELRVSVRDDPPAWAPRTRWAGPNPNDCTLLFL